MHNNSEPKHESLEKPTMKEAYTKILLDFMRPAGEVAMDLISNSQPGLKPDQSVITEADLQISDLCHRLLKPCLDEGHILIDEEKLHLVKHITPDQLAELPYVWALDPIDGTRPFANQMPLFGISLGLLHYGRPLLGAVHMPMLKELYYSNGDQAFFVQNPFTNNEQVRPIRPIDEPLSHRSIFLSSESILKSYRWNYLDCSLLEPQCAVVGMCWPAIGRGCGYLLNANLWDFVGSWPIAHAAGLKLWELESGEEVKQLSAQYFGYKGDTWKLKAPLVLASTANAQPLRQRIERR